MINSPVQSKINLAALAVLVVGVVNTAGWIPPEYQDHAIKATTLLAPVLIMTFRTWFTQK